MIKKKVERGGPIEVDLTGPDGNAFVLIAMAHRWAKQLGLNADEIETDMTSGDYEHLVSVMEKHFGKMVVFYR
jgi:hypothetical protein